MLRTCVALRNRPWETYVAFATCVALVCVASPAHAQSCTYVGAQMYCSNGLSSNSVGKYHVLLQRHHQAERGADRLLFAPPSRRQLLSYTPPAPTVRAPPAIRR